MAKKVETANPLRCPACGGTLELDEMQRPEQVIAANNARGGAAANAARFAQTVQKKADEHGLVHTCNRCQYQARLLPAA